MSEKRMHKAKEIMLDLLFMLRLLIVDISLNQNYIH